MWAGLNNGIGLAAGVDGGFEVAAARAIVEELAAMGDNFDFEGIESLIIQANEFLEKYPRIKDGDA